MGGAAQARVPQRTPGWVLWTVGEILNNAGDPEPNVMFWMYTSTRIWISACDRSNSMVVPCIDKLSLPITNLNADKMTRYVCTILELSFRSTHTTVLDVFYPVASHTYHVTLFIYTRLFLSDHSTVL